ncbi:MAG: DNA polymerase III subunit epsilon [Pseudomonadota bacterium]
MREIVFDTETTGLSARDGHRVIEIGAIELVNRFATGKTFHVYIDPEGKEVEAGALKVHGISNEMLKDKPKFSEIADDFLAFFAEGMLVAHNASFDVGFLNAELQRLKKPQITPERVVDTLQIARRKHPGSPNSLDALCNRYGIDNGHRTKHGALLDSELLAEVYLELSGGRQAALMLGTSSESSETPGEMVDEADVAISARPNPLPSRLTQKERDAHQAFVEALGDDATWKKYPGLLN